MDQDTRSKIAAGEVVERPASVVKELVENAIDAGATAITIEVEGGGLAIIRVTDNGSGIEPDDVVLAFERHATSKISRADDLEAIFTLGFRGEALASIAAVAKVRMETVRQGFSEGVFVEFEGGVMKAQGIVGRPGGTAVTVSELFYNTPARLKYVKSPQAEAARIKDVIDRFVLGYPHLSFMYASGGKKVLHSPGTGDIKGAIAAVYGNEIAKQMIPVQYSWDDVKIDGYVGSPDVSRANRSFQTFFVNGRYIRSPLLSKALEEAFSTLIMVNHFPFCVINLALDPHEVDVNVHPAKIEVRFVDERKVAAALFYAVKQALSIHGLLGSSSLSVSAEVNSENDGGKTPQVAKDGDSFEQAELKPKMPIDGYRQPNVAQPAKVNEALRVYEPMLTASFEHDAQPSMRVLGSLFSSYLLIERGDELCIIDQHAAHERILYERYMEMFQKQHIEVQYLVSPVLLELTAIDQQLLEENMELLRSLGFEIEPFDSDTWVLKAVPVLFGQPQAERLLKDILDGMRLFDRSNPYNYRQQGVMMLACRSAVKAHDPLDQKQIVALAASILGGSLPPTCPHGRPIVRCISRYELEKMFKRIQ